MVEIDNLNNFIADKTVCVLDIYSPGCAPCRILAPKLTEWAAKYQIPAAKMNINENMPAAAELNINLLPTVIFFKNGKETSRLIGIFEEEQFKRAIN